VHGDAPTGQDALGRRVQTGPGRERVRVRRREERARRLQLTMAAPHEHLGEHVRAAQRQRQPLGGGELVR
jgi:hypothetical protein